MKHRVEFNRHLEIGELNGAHEVTMRFYHPCSNRGVQVEYVHEVKHMHAWRYLPHTQELRLWLDPRLHESIMGDMIDVDVKEVLNSLLYEQIRKYRMQALAAEQCTNYDDTLLRCVKKLVIHWPKHHLTDYVKNTLLREAADEAIRDHLPHSVSYIVETLEIQGI